CHYANWSFNNHPKCTYDGKTPDVCPPKNFQALPHLVYRNNGNGTFTDVSKSAGLRLPREEKDYIPLHKDLKEEALVRLKAAGTSAADAEREAAKSADDACGRLRAAADPKELTFGKGLGVVLVDVDLDGKPDVYVANDTVDNFLYINRSRPGKILF